MYTHEQVVLCFSDNFDWGRMKSDLVRGLLESELNEWNIYCHNLSDEYAVAITDPHIYDSVRYIITKKKRRRIF